MKEHHIPVNKTARYYTLGTASDKIENLWFVLHGYGQLADYFLRNFETISDNDKLIVAPEGFHRFYLEGVKGRVGASWMTKEDRLKDIDDYVNYLDHLYDTIISQLAQNVNITFLGFFARMCHCVSMGTNGKIKMSKPGALGGCIPA